MHYDNLYTDLYNNTEYDVIYDGWAVPKDFQSDGCSMPPWVHRLLKANRWDNNACRLHDFLRGYKIVPRRTADNLLRQQIRDHVPGLRYYIISWLVWIAIRLARPWYKDTRVLPDKWEKFRYNSFGEKDVI